MSEPAPASREHAAQSSAAAAPASTSPPPPRVGARYDVIGDLGRGGMGAIYHVRDAATGRELALKQLRAPGDERVRSKLTVAFEREFYRLAELSHPRVIQVHDYGVDARGPFYTMELLAGGDLKERAPLDYREACALVLDVCSCLSLLHSRRLVHRDISPRNIRCTQDGHAKLIDFGAVVPMGPCLHTVGTAAFVAPEVVHRLTLDARTDLFSLGATLYFTLTGRVPFAAREFADLRQAWAQKPAEASQHAPGVPAELDALLASLLSIDPAKRPRTAFEVSQRLAAICGIEHEEPADVSRAYLSTPNMVGRDAAIRAFRHDMRRALAGQGGGLLIEGAAGVGRSRMLDACTLEAKTLGAVVLRANARASSGAAFADAEQLVEQLLEALPDAARGAGRAAGVPEALVAAEVEPGADPVRPRLSQLATAEGARVGLQNALLSWFLGIARAQALVIAVDDAQRMDEATAALLAALAHAARDARLLVAVTVETPAPADAPAALRVLLQQCGSIRLVPLSAGETRALLGSIFGEVPNVALVSDRIYHAAGGNPRESIALARHMLDQGRIGYQHGTFTLPSQLEVADLPASVEEALAARTGSLPALARRLLQALALSTDVAFTRADCVTLAEGADEQQLEHALLALVERELVSSDGSGYALANRSWAATIVAPLPENERAARHAALAATHARREDAQLLVVYHLLAAGRHEQALDHIASAFPVVDLRQMGPTLYAMPQLRQHIAAMLERARELAESLGRPPREINTLHVLCSLAGSYAPGAVFHRATRAWLARIELDSGLADYRALAADVPEGERWKRALQQTAARYEATEQTQRVYRVDEAITALASYVLLGILVGARTLDVGLLRTLPLLLEPLVALAPPLLGVQRSARATYEAFCRAQPGRAEACWIELYAMLEAAAQTEWAARTQGMRMAIAYALGELQAHAGRVSALRWIELLEQDPLMRVNALYLRRILSLQQGDAAGAEALRMRAEIAAVQAGTFPAFDPLLRCELVAHYLARDLTSLKQVADRIEQLAAQHPGWLSYRHLALGFFQTLRGDLDASQAAFERCIADNDPDRDDPPACLDVWLQATAGAMACLSARGRAREAAAAGERALARCRELEVDGWMEAVVRELALAEALLGECARASARLDALIAEQQRMGVGGLPLGIGYEARARVAIAAHDAEAATRFAQLAGAEYRHGRSSSLAAHYERLLDDARRAGVHVPAEASGFESSVLGSTAVLAPETASGVARALASASDFTTRAERALSLLCEADDARAGQLYLLHEGALTHVASHGCAARDGELDGFVAGYFRQQLDDLGMSEALTAVTQLLPSAGAWTDRHGGVHHLLMIGCKRGGAMVYAGVAVLQLRERARPSGALALTAAIGAQLLQAETTAG